MESLIEKLNNIRDKKKEIDYKEKEIRNEIISLLDKDNKTIFSFGDWVIQKKIKYIKTIKKNIILPDDNYDIKQVFQLFIKNKSDIQLVGNKFMVNKRK